VAVNYPSHPITSDFRVLTAYPLARSMEAISGGVNGRTAQPIIETSPRSWGETDLKDLMEGQPVKLEEEKGDRPGPLTVGLAVSVPAPSPPAADAAKATDTTSGTPPETDRKPETRLVAIGDSDFASNLALNIQGNRDLFLNTINWLAQQENLIAIRPRQPDDRRITLTAEQQKTIFWLSIAVIPGLLLVTGIHTWWRRR